MDGLSYLRLILIVVASLIFLVLLINLVYVLYSRRRFRQRSQSGEVQGEPYDNTTVVPPPSKELLYFFSWEYGNGNGAVYSVEPNVGIREAVHVHVQPNAPWQASYGGELKLPKPIIFGPIKPKTEEECRDCDEMVSPPEEAVVVEVQEDSVAEEDATPFSTASPSPFFYTPFSSPGRDEESAEGDIPIGSRDAASSSRVQSS